jgi:lysophospholipase L1-like esterase
MKKLKYLLLTAVFILLFSPSNGQKIAGNLDIVYIGNSITQGVQLSDPAEEAPPAFAAKYIRTLKGVESARFLNRGKSGYTTVNFLPTPDGELSKAISAVKEFHTDGNRLLVFSIMLGTNDSAEEGPKGSPLYPEEYYFNIKAITDKLLTEFRGCIVIYQQPVWYSPTTYNRSRYLKAGLERLQTYFPELKALVAEYSAAGSGQVFLGDTKAFDYFKENYLTDLIPEQGNAGTFYLHPNKKGAEALGKFWGDAIYEVIFKK